MPVFDLHCDTLTAFMSPLRCQDTLDDPCSAFALSKVQTIPWCQCCAVFVPRAEQKYRPVYIGGDPYAGTYYRRGEGDWRCPRHEVEAMLQDQKG